MFQIQFLMAPFKSVRWRVRQSGWSASPQGFVTSVRPFPPSLCFCTTAVLQREDPMSWKNSMSCLVPAIPWPRGSAELLLLCRNEKWPLPREDKETLLSHSDVGTQKMPQHFTVRQREAATPPLTLHTHRRRANTGFCGASHALRCVSKSCLCHLRVFFNCVSKNNVWIWVWLHQQTWRETARRYLWGSSTRQTTSYKKKNKKTRDSRTMFCGCNLSASSLYFSLSTSQLKTFIWPRAHEVTDLMWANVWASFTSCGNYLHSFFCTDTLVGWSCTFFVPAFIFKVTVKLGTVFLCSREKWSGAASLNCHCKTYSLICSARCEIMRSLRAKALYFVIC